MSNKGEDFMSREFLYVMDASGVIEILKKEIDEIHKDIAKRTIIEEYLKLIICDALVHEYGLILSCRYDPDIKVVTDDITYKNIYDYVMTALLSFIPSGIYKDTRKHMNIMLVNENIHILLGET